MRHLKSKVARPMKPWEKQRIIEEQALVTEYAYKNKNELWRMKSKVGALRNFAKKLVSIRTNQQVKEREEFVKSIFKKGLIKEGAVVEDILALTVRDISERRLQTLVFRKGFSKTAAQARQLIVHGRVYIGDKKVTAPGMIISRSEEALIRVNPLPVSEAKK